MSIKEFVKKAKKPCEAVIAMVSDYRAVMEKEDKTVGKELQKLAEAATKVKKYVDAHTEQKPEPELFTLKEEVAEKLGLSTDEQYTRNKVSKLVSKYLVDNGMYDEAQKNYQVDEATKELFGFAQCEFKKLSVQKCLIKN